MLDKYGFAQPKMDDKSSVVFIKHDPNFIEQQKLYIVAHLFLMSRIPGQCH